MPICAAWSVTIPAATSGSTDSTGAKPNWLDTACCSPAIGLAGASSSPGTAVAATDCSCSGVTSARPASASAALGFATNACAAFSSRNRSRMNWSTVFIGSASLLLFAGRTGH